MPNLPDKPEQPNMTTEPPLVHRDAFLIVGMRITTQPMASDIPALWQAFVPQIGEIKNVAEPRVSYGLMDNFDRVGGSLEYMAGISISCLENLPGGMTMMEIPSNTYAVFEAALPRIGEVFGHIFNTWLPTSGFDQADAPYFERYGEEFDPADPAAVVEIFIPIKPQG